MEYYHFKDILARLLDELALMSSYVTIKLQTILELNRPNIP